MKICNLLFFFQKSHPVDDREPHTITNNNQDIRESILGPNNLPELQNLLFNLVAAKVSKKKHPSDLLTLMCSTGTVSCSSDHTGTTSQGEAAACCVRRRMEKKRVRGKTNVGAARRVCSCKIKKIKKRQSFRQAPPLFSCLHVQAN